MWSVSRGQLPGEGEDLLLLLRSFFRCLARGSVHVDGGWWDDGEKGLEKEVSALCVEVHRQWSVEICSWDAERYNGNCDGRARDLGGRVCDGAERWKVGTMCGKDNIVRWVEGNLVAAVGGGLVGLGRVDGKHVGGHLGREIVDHDGELLGESWREWKRSWLDASKDPVHSGGDVGVC